MRFITALSAKLTCPKPNARPIRHNGQVPDRNGKIFYTSITSLSHISKKGRFLAVASSKPEAYVIRILEHLDLLQYFDEVVGASMDEKRSAKKDVIEEALRRMGKAPGDPSILMIGDRMHDVEGARLCGLDSLGIYTGFAAEGELEDAGATYVVHSIDDMAEFLLRE